MPFIWITAYYPSHLRDEVIKKWVESRRKFPEDTSLYETIIDVGSKTTKDGTKVVSIAKVKEGKLEEALTYIGRIMMMFQLIAGFEYEVELYSTGEEALEALGMKMPAR